MASFSRSRFMAKEKANKNQSQKEYNDKDKDPPSDVDDDSSSSDPNINIDSNPKRAPQKGWGQSAERQRRQQQPLKRRTSQKGWGQDSMSIQPTEHKSHATVGSTSPVGKLNLHSGRRSPRRYRYCLVPLLILYLLCLPFVVLLLSAHAC